jgi:hydrogenase maturation protease
MTDRPRIAVAGIGNILLGDEGLGVYAARELEAGYAGRDDVQVLDGGTLGLMLLPYIEDSTHILLLDALSLDAPAGTLREYDQVSMQGAPVSIFSVHGISVPDLSNLMRFRSDRLEAVHLIGMVPSSLDASTDLSDEVKGAMPAIVELARQRIDSWLKAGVS